MLTHRPFCSHAATSARRSDGSANLKNTLKLYSPRLPERTLPFPTTVYHFETGHELATTGHFDG